MKSIRAKAFHLRGGIWTLLFAVILFMAYPTKLSVAGGLPFVILGQALRFWAAGCIGRYRGERVGALSLTTWGPYAFVRNPLYIGNALIGLGWSIMAAPLAAVIFVITFVLLYTVLIVPHEESFLLEKFGGEYSRYRDITGSFFPKFSSGWPGVRISGPFDVKVLWASELHSLLMTVAGSLLIIAKGIFKA
ncbi:MAG: isoprenylcysteine carboxylmethyltransferase family protein [Synergistaceae bacterium]|nr:isoprenylcysteine carboxylmethyltransferase family protein [Synergistaceae bacterium]